MWDMLRSSSVISVDTQFDWAVGIARGMQALHLANVLHLDLSTRNVLLLKDSLSPKVGDYGFTGLLFSIRFCRSRCTDLRL